MSKLAHHCLAACIGGLAAVANAPAARADSGPVIVVPSRHGVPTVIAGRNEVEPSPDRIMPEPAESFSRSWGTQSDAQHVAKELGKRPYHPAAEVPATLDEPNVFNPPIVIVPRRRP